MNGLPDWSRLRHKISGAKAGRATLTQSVSAELIGDLTRCAQSGAVSVAALFQVSLAATLMADESRIQTAFFVTDAGRPAELPELADAVGLFIATLPMTFSSTSDPVIDEAREMSARLREAVGHWPPPQTPHPVCDDAAGCARNTR